MKFKNKKQEFWFRRICDFTNLDVRETTKKKPCLFDDEHDEHDEQERKRREREMRGKKSHSSEQLWRHYVATRQYIFY